MVNRTKISKEIRRRAGGAGQYKPKTAAEIRKKAAEQKTNLSQKDWEKIEGTGTSPTNPPRYRMKKEARAKQKSKFKVKQAKKREEVTAPAVKALRESVGALGPGAPWAKLTKARRDTKKVTPRRPTEEGGIESAAQVRLKNRSMREEAERQAAKKLAISRFERPPRKPDARLRAIASDVPESERERIEFDDPDFYLGGGKKGGKVSKSKGGTVKKMRGGKLHTKKTKTTYERHDGNLAVSSLYTIVGE
jgi:hypothetical protein